MDELVDLLVVILDVTANGGGDFAVFLREGGRHLAGEVGARGAENRLPTRALEERMIGR